jgi:predicted cobalt transporter CbtA
MYSLRRVTDNAGDSGTMSQAIFWDEEGNPKVEENAEPRVGVKMRVGSHVARSYQRQDWWVTTFVTSIIEKRPGYVRFATGNSVYEWENK